MHRTAESGFSPIADKVSIYFCAALDMNLFILYSHKIQKLNSSKKHLT